MKVMVVYDSVFGNTEKVARAIGDALGGGPGGPSPEVGVVRPGEVKVEQLRGLDLLIVGSPTRGFRPTEAVTGLLKSLPAGALGGTRAAAFDTRISVADIRSRFLRFMVDRAGYAAKRIAGRLRRGGGQLAAPPEGFFVKDTEGPLKDGELERAADWARRLVEGGQPHPRP